MRGTFSFYEDGELVGQRDNLITTAGKSAVLRYLAKMVPDYAGSILVGLDGTAPVVGDMRLGYQTAAAPVIMKSVDYTNQTVLFKATLDSNWAGRIYESGLSTLKLDSLTGAYATQIITTFAPYETWTASTSGTVVQTDAYSYAPARVGTEYEYASIQTNSGWISYDYYKNLDLSGYSSTDQVVFGHISWTAKLSTLVLTFTDGAGYTATIPTTNVTTHVPAEGVAQYNIYRVNKGNFTLSNAAFDWSNIVKITVRTNGSASAGTSAYGQGAWDFIGMLDKDDLNLNSVLVSRVAAGTEISCTFQVTPNTVTYNNHGLRAGDEIIFKTVTTTTGISANTKYYVVNPTTNTFQVALTVGGAAIDLLTADGTGVYYAPPLAIKSAGKVMDIEYKLVFNL
jgi:hypothetical protein